MYLKFLLKSFICSQLMQSESHWHKTENWLRQRYTELHPGGEQNVDFRILGYQWRTLRFNEDTRQSTAKVMAAYKESDPGSIFLRQEAHCLAVPCNFHQSYL